MSRQPWKIWVDTGGTFTDCLAYSPNGTLKRLKVLSSSVLRLKVKQQPGSSSFRVEFPLSLSKDFLSGFTVVVNNVRCSISRFDPETSVVTVDKKFPLRGVATLEITSNEEVPVFASRLLTETALPEKFPPIELKLGSTRGTNALLERKGAKTALLITRGFKDLLLIGHQQRPDLFALNIKKEKPIYDLVAEIDERITCDGTILKAVDKKSLKNTLALMKKKKIESVAVAFLNSYRNPAHEHLVKEFLHDAGFQFVSVSHELSPQIKILPRAETSVTNSYLHPVINNYVKKITDGLRTNHFYIMSSAGGLLNASSFQPKDSLLSGPAGGVIGAIRKAQQSGLSKIITFDMGGTSTDVSLCQGRPDYRFECTVGNLKILSPSIAIETIAAGGGSICFFDGYRFLVGPHSAGASPGPASYGKGGPLTITDVNLLLGRLDEENFSIPVHAHWARERLTQLLQDAKRSTKGDSPEAILTALIQIANEKMVEAIRKVSIQRGHNPAEYALLCFGGAGGQHACSLAAMLGISKIIIPYDAGLLSAYGIGHARREKVKEQLILKNLYEFLPEIDFVFSQLRDAALTEIGNEGVNRTIVKCKERLLFLRLKGQETTFEIEYDPDIDVANAFKEKYKKIYGHWIDDREIEVESVRVIVAEEDALSEKTSSPKTTYSPLPFKRKKIYVGNRWVDSPVYKWENMKPGASIKGPALIISDNSTVFVEPNWRTLLDETDNLILTAGKHLIRFNHDYAHEAELELFTNRFTSIAQDMGALLQRSSFSVNVKERLDFSCALLDRDGNLIVNAPHIPVHLGSLGVCVRELVKKIPMHAGDVVITNHPAFGGSHLPDITLVRPVYYDGDLLGFVANRAHHAEVGGKKPGSMPADATCLEEEGVVIHPAYLMRQGNADWNFIERTLLSARYPTRALQENLADLNGALASLILGEEELVKLAKDHGVDKVTHYMTELKRQAHNLLRKKIETLPTRTLKAREYLDDGSCLNVTVKREQKKLVIDFSGSSAVHQGNLNATKAIVNSVVLYVLRILLNKPIPLNEGLLRPVKLIIPKGMLNPAFHKNNQKSPAVVGGNTEVSQRLTDALLKAFSLAACSQGNE